MNTKTAKVNTDVSNIVQPMMMSTLEIVTVAESLGVSKSHKHVLRDARVMLLKLYGGDKLASMLPKQAPGRFLSANAETLFDQVFGDESKWIHGEDGPTLGHDSPTLGNVGIEVKRDERSYIAEIMFDKDHATTLVTKYSDKLRLAMIRRIGELEKALTEKALPAPAAPVAPQAKDERVADLHLSVAALTIAAGMFKYGDDRKLELMRQVFSDNGAPTYLLPSATTNSFDTGDSATHHLGVRGIGIGARTFNKMCLMAGLVEKKWRESKKKIGGKLVPLQKPFWSITDKGLTYGKNERSKFAEETVPMFYDCQFTALLNVLRPHYQAISASGYKPLWPSHENAERARTYIQTREQNAEKKREQDNRERAERAADCR
jgi:hypothetical protein